MKDLNTVDTGYRNEDWTQGLDNEKLFIALTAAEGLRASSSLSFHLNDG